MGGAIPDAHEPLRSPQPRRMQPHLRPRSTQMAPGDRLLVKGHDGTLKAWSAMVPAGGRIRQMRLKDYDLLRQHFHGGGGRCYLVRLVADLFWIAQSKRLSMRSDEKFSLTYLKPSSAALVLASSSS